MCRGDFQSVYVSVGDWRLIKSLFVSVGVLATCSEGVDVLGAPSECTYECECVGDFFRVCMWV